MSRRSKRLKAKLRPSPEPLDLTPSAINRMFPLEIIYSFMSLCKPKELYPLTFVCRSWQHEAERLLYGNLYLQHRRLEQMWSCLMALAAYPHKAVLVRSFNVCHPTGLDPMLLKKICAVLPVLPSLVHLGLLLPHRPSFLRSLNSALKRCTFTLTSLSIDTSLLYMEWIQPRLELLRAVVVQACSPPSTPVLLKTFQMYFARNNNTHLFCTSCTAPAPRINRIYTPDTLTVFPEFAPGIATWDPRIIKNLFCVSNNAKATDIRRFRIYVKNLSDEKLVRNILEPIAKTFRHVNRIDLLVQDAQMNHFTAEISSTFSSFKMLDHLNIECRDIPGEGSCRFSQEDCNRLASTWVGDIPKLRCLYLPNGVFSELYEQQWAGQ